ncbi:MAG: leucine-rich repeat protein [Ruminococcus sp.]|nr:leucine-rich repeat protein [Ruminococcus sp.]
MTKLIKKSVSIILTLLLMISVFTLVPVSADAATPDSDFTFDSSTGTITRYNGTDTVVDIPSTIGGVSVTSIGDYAFYSKTAVTSVIIPNSVISIGTYAFYYCTSLTDVTIPNGVTNIGDCAFCDCTSLTSITIPNSVTSIGDYAFYNCTSLTDVTIGNGVTSMGYSVFYNCNNVTNLTVNGNYQFDTGRLPSSTKNLIVTGNSIKYHAFGNNLYSLESVTIPNTVTSIGDEAFISCSNLTDLTIPNSVESIGEFAFALCSSLTSIEIPNSVESIGGYAFNGCANLTSVTIGSGVTSIGNAVFTGANVIDLTVIGNGQFDYSKLPYSTVKNLTVTGTAVTSGAFSSFTALEGVTIDDTVESVGANAFSGGSEILFAVFENGDTVIDTNAFGDYKPIIVGYDPSTAKSFASNNEMLFIDIEDFASLEPSDFVVGPYGNGVKIKGYKGSDTDITIPSTIYGFSVTGIDSSAFSNSDITSITIPASVTSIGSGAFNNCSDLWDITVNSGNANYSSQNGVLYNKNKTTLIQYPAGKTVTSFSIPNSVNTIGSGAFFNCSNLTSLTIPVSVTTIESGAFSGCSGLISLTIPNSVTSLGGGAFSGCTNLTNVVIGNSVTSLPGGCFAGLSNLESVTIGSSVESINGGAFSGCSSLTSIVIPDSVTFLSSGVFSGCTSLSSITIGNGLTSITSGCFYGLSSLESVTIGNHVEEIQGGAFGNCSSLTSLVIPDSVTFLSAGVFGGCTSLESVTIGDGLTSISGGCFSGVSSLKNVTLGTNVEEIQGGAFNNCSNLESVTLGDKVTSIGGSAFYGCSSLESIELPDSLTTIGGSAFGASGLISIDIPSGVTTINSNTFQNCADLTSVTIPNTVTTIDDDAFRNSGLTSVVIPNSVTSLGKSVFRDCSSLKGVTIGNGVTSLDEYVFGYCTSLRSVSIPSSVNDIHVYAFAGCPYFSLYGHGSSSGLPMSPSLYSSYFNLDEYEYTVNVNGTATITKYNGSASEIDVPSELPSSDGFHTVAAIGANAFKNKTGLTKATIPISVESFGSGAFDGCTNLTLYGFSNTASYAESNNIPFVLLVKINTGSGYTYAPLTDTQTKDGGDSSFGLAQNIYGNIELIGVQQKADTTNTMRFVSVINEGIIKDAKEGGDVVDYGFVMAKTDYTSTASATNSFISKVTLDAPNTLKNSCMYTDNNFSGAYGKNSTDTKYKYVTLAVKNVPSNQGFVVRFYIKMKSGDVYYANYNTSFTGCVTNYAALTSALS